MHVISHNDSFVDEAIRLTVLGKVRSDCSMDGWMASGVAVGLARYLCEHYSEDGQGVVIT